MGPAPPFRRSPQRPRNAGRDAAGAVKNMYRPDMEEKLYALSTRCGFPKERLIAHFAARAKEGSPLLEAIARQREVTKMLAKELFHVWRLYTRLTRDGRRPRVPTTTASRLRR